MDPFAAPSDLEDRWRALSASESSRAAVLLGQASREVRAICPGVDDRVTAGVLDPELVADVVCDMVKRSMASPVDQQPLSSMQQTAGPFSMTNNFANPSGAIYLTKSEKRKLGCGGQRAFTVDLLASSSSSSS